MSDEDYWGDHQSHGDLKWLRGVSSTKMLRETLGLVRPMGCGGMGCVFLTNQHTAVKLVATRATEVRTTCDAVNELRMASVFKSFVGQHVAVPHITEVGVIRSNTHLIAFVEREALNTPSIDVRDANFFRHWGGANDILDRIQKHSKLRIADRVRLSELQPVSLNLIEAMMNFAEWCYEHGVYLDDVGAVVNWGLRADGTLVLRDYGECVVRSSFRKKFVATANNAHRDLNVLKANFINTLPVVYTIDD